MCSAGADVLRQGRGGASSSGGGVGLPWREQGSTEHLTVGGGVVTSLQDPALLLLLEAWEEEGRWPARYSLLPKLSDDVRLPCLSLGVWYTGSSNSSSDDQDDRLPVTVPMLSMEPNWQARVPSPSRVGSWNGFSSTW